MVLPGHETIDDESAGSIAGPAGERVNISVPFRGDEHAALVPRLLGRYRNQVVQLADACLVQMSELKRDCRMFTLAKSEFQVCPRFERQTIPLVEPE